MIVVIKPGFLDMVMDWGRPGFRVQGVPEGGAADLPSLVHANRLVGNPDHAAGLEMTLRGPVLRFPDGAKVAFAGADMGVQGDGVPLAPACLHVLAPGATLHVGVARSGMRAYLAVAGGIDVPVILGSRSTFLPGGWGGWQGRALKTGDQLPVGAEAGQAWDRLPGRSSRSSSVLRVVAGPQMGGFSDVALTSFLQKSFVVQSDSNRVGIRLFGPVLEYAKGELASQAVLPGAVQVPPGGQPIILGWDGPVTGGYPVIAGVITADLPNLAQLKPGDAVRFQAVSLEHAQSAWQQESTWLA
jgi:biotin-dependent carboxylase-like uncharacterized protein